MYNYKFKQIYSGYSHSIAHDIDGYIYGSGINDYGQLNSGELDELCIKSFIHVNNIDDIKQIACGSQHTVILKNDGSVWGCGNNYSGQLGFENPILDFQVIQIDISDVKQIACGSQHTVILKNDGSVWACGLNIYGQLGLCNTTNRTTFTQVTTNINNDVKEIACGGFHTFILKNDGSVWACGNNGNGQLGLGDTTNKTSFTQVTTNINNDVKQIACGYMHTFIIKNDGSIWSCGLNGYGQLGLGNTTNRTTFTQVTTNINNDIKEIACGGYQTFIIKNDGSLWSCGYNRYGQLGLGDITAKTSFTQVTTNVNNDVKQISCGQYYTFILKNDGSIWSCGYNGSGQLGLGTSDTSAHSTFTQVTAKNNDIKEIACGHNYTVILKNNGIVLGAGDAFDGQLVGFEYYNKLREFKKIYDKPVKKIWYNPEAYDLYVLKNDDTLYVCGANWYGAQGVGSYDSTFELTQVAYDVKDIFFSDYTTFILKNDGSVWVAGCNCAGEAGFDSYEYYDFKTYTQIDINNVKKIFVGDEFTFFLKNDSTLWSCGYNKYGQLGLGHTNNVDVITQVADNVKDVTVGYYSDHTVILKNDGSVWGCGRNDYGQLGLGNTTQRNTFTQVTTNINNDVKEIKSWYDSTFLIKNDNSLWVAGANNCCQLGIEGANRINTLTESLDNVDRLYFDYCISYAIKNDGTLWVCGINRYGNIGLGSDYNECYTWTNVDFPEDATNIKEINVFDEHTFIIMNDGSAYFCGNNNYGVNGCHPSIAETTHMITTFTKYELPDINFGNYTIMNNDEKINIVNSSCGNYHESLIDENNRVFVRGDNEYGQLGLGDNETRDDYTLLEIDGIDQIKSSREITIIKKDSKFYVAGRYIGNKFEEYEFQYINQKNKLLRE